MPVLHAKTTGDRTELVKADPLIQMPCVHIRSNDRIKLQDAKAQLMGFRDAVFHKHLSDMQSPACGSYRIAGVRDMAASADIVRVQDIKPQDFPCLLLDCHTAEALLRKKGSP